MDMGKCLQAIVCAGWIAICTASVTAQATYYVNGGCGNDAWTGTNEACEDPDGPKKTIQDAIDGAVDGDTVIVADGVYTGNGNIDLNPNGRSITIRSASGPENCIIDCAGAGRAFTLTSGEPIETIIQGFTITNGSAEVGGGIYLTDASATIVDCVISKNSAQIGGAIYLHNSGDLAILDTSIIANQAGSVGGVFANNDAAQGFLFLNNCVVTDNTCTVTIGGIGNGQRASRVSNCIVARNVGCFAGGGFLDIGVDQEFTNCVVSRNSADLGAGYIGANNTVVDIINCAFSNNLGDAVDPSFANLRIHNSVIWGSTGEQIVGKPLSVAYSNIQGGWDGVGNIDADPLFVQPGSDDVHLTFGSPCLDAGDNEAVPVDVLTDLDGEPRFQDDPDAADTGNGTPPIVDMGPYEGGNKGGAAADETTDFDQGETVILIPDGGELNLLEHAAIIVTNVSGDDDATFSVTQFDSIVHPGAQGFSELGFILRTETSLNPGEYLMRLSIPFGSDVIGAYGGFETLDVTRFFDGAGNWALGVLTNTVDSPGRHGPIGDHFVVENTDNEFGLNEELGDYGLYWNPNSLQGLVWANLDEVGDYGFGAALCPADCEPFAGNGAVDSSDLVQVLGGWGLAGASDRCDLNRDDIVDGDDLLMVLGQWGICPVQESAQQPSNIEIAWRQLAEMRARSEARRRDVPVIDRALAASRSDVDGNGAVDLRDLELLQANWGASRIDAHGTPSAPGTPGDVDADGDVDARDMILLLGNWG